jgi:hypothetical protein
LWWQLIVWFVSVTISLFSLFSVQHILRINVYFNTASIKTTFRTITLRCYTDISATKSYSTECGLNTGCVKIYIDSEDMLYRKQTEKGYGYGYKPDYQLPPQYRNNPVLVRGCFVLKVPDRCYTAKNGLSYCWCSTKDLCNSATAHTKIPAPSYVRFMIQYVLTWNCYPQSLQNVLQNGISLDEGNVLVCFQLILSAFFWYTYNSVIHRFFFLHHENIL